ncbi:MAG TPA: nuclear transport factor 2 family protein [Flavobacteriales bacterium]
MKRFFPISIVCLLLYSCSAPMSQQPELQDKVAVLKTIHTLMAEQQSAWNAGDLENYMKAYWKSDSLCFIGKSGITYGWQSTLENYRKGYASREEMGHLQFTNLNTELLSDSAAFVIGKWQLFRKADTLSGYYTLLWKRFPDGWYIVADHSS